MIAIPSDLWAKLHGASTHFPIAMVLSGCAFDMLAAFAWKKPLGRDARVAGTYALVLGTLGGILAVISGLYLTKGEVWGADALRWHHRFVWPAFGLLVSAATWRLVVGDKITRRSHAIYLMMELVLSGLMAGAGHWGAELLQGVS